MTNWKNVFLTAACILLVGAMLMRRCDRKEIERLRNNQELLATSGSAGMKVYTTREFKKYMPTAFKHARDLGIAPRQIEYYTQIVTQYRDSLVTVENCRIDTVMDQEVRYFNYYSGCFTITGICYHDSTSLTPWHTDTLDAFMHWYKKGPWILRWLKKKIYRSTIYSYCLKDTVAVLENVQVTH